MTKFNIVRESDRTLWGFDYDLSEVQIGLFLQGQVTFDFQQKIEGSEEFETITNNGTLLKTLPVYEVAKVPAWTDLKNALFDNFALIAKCLGASSYGLLTSMIVSAEAGATVYESNFLKIWNLLAQELVAKGNALTQPEIDFINEKLVEYDFSITI